MDTKLKGDIAEQQVVLYALKNGWGALNPIGDRLPYDLVLDIKGVLIKVQVKSAWFDAKRQNYVVDNRSTKTNRRKMIRAKYSPADFDFAVIYIDDLDIFYIFPCEVFISYASEIHLVESEKRQRKPKSAKYRNAWDLVLGWAAAVK
ncbi:MAG TPA: endonuclease [Bacteroidetes bacterium]|nr:endonuclease [Bacteroidota bacterium]